MSKQQTNVCRTTITAEKIDSLCLQLVLQNAKRGGDVTHIRAEDLDKVEIKDGYGELTVSMQC
jgi:hypothetical protein